MSYHDLIQLYFERSTALQWYWTLYVIVIGGLLAFSSIRRQFNPLTTVLVTILFAGFAYKNLGAIQDTSVQRNATLTLIKQASEAGVAASTQPVVKPSQDVLEPTLITTDLDATRNFHVACAILTVAAIWAMELRRRNSADNAGSTAK